MNGPFWPGLLLLLAGTCSALDLDSLCARMLANDPGLAAARERIETAAFETRLVGLRSPFHLESEVRSPAAGPTDNNGGYRLEVSRNLPLDNRLELATALARLDEQRARVAVCQRRGELLATFQRTVLEAQGSRNERAVLNRALSIQDSLLSHAEQLQARGEFSALQLAELRRDGWMLQREIQDLELQLASRIRELGRFSFGPEPDEADLAVWQVAIPHDSLPSPARVAAGLDLQESRLRTRLESPRALRELELGLGVDGEREADAWAHSLVLRVAAPLPAPRRLELRRQALALMEHRAARQLAASERDLYLAVAGNEDLLHELDSRETLLQERETLSAAELHLRERVWADGLAPRLDVLAARLDHVLLERDAVRQEQLRRLLLFERALLTGALPGTHDPHTCRCTNGSITDEE